MQGVTSWESLYNSGNDIINIGRLLKDAAEQIEQLQDKVNNQAERIRELQDKRTDPERPGWIPAAERMPGQNGRYLCTIRRTVKPESRDLFGDDETMIRIIRYIDGFKLPAHVPNWINKHITDEVIAWQSLPDPYGQDAPGPAGEAEEDLEAVYTRAGIISLLP